MTWSRQHSHLEALMVKVLKNKAMTLTQVVEAIMTLDPSAFIGKTPKNSMYSIVIRTEKRRLERGERQLFKTSKRDGRVYYALSEKGKRC